MLKNDEIKVLQMCVGEVERRERRLKNENFVEVGAAVRLRHQRAQLLECSRHFCCTIAICAKECSRIITLPTHLDFVQRLYVARAQKIK